MTKPQIIQRLKRVIKVTGRAAILTGLSLLIVFLLLLGAINLPWVQTYMVNYFAESISAQLHYPIKIGEVSISWLDRLVLYNVNVHDTKNRPMIHVKRITVNFDLPTLFRHRVVLDEAVLTEADVLMVTDSTTGHINLSEFVDAITNLTATPGDTVTVANPNPSVFSINNVFLDNARFTMDDQGEDSIRDGFDYYHATFDSLNAHVSAFRQRADTIEMQVTNLRTTERASRLRIHKLNTFLRTSRHEMSLTNLDADIGKSHIANRVVFSFENWGSFSDFNRTVKMDLRMLGTSVDLKDLALFAPSVKSFHDVAKLTGRFTGTVDKLRSSGASLGFGTHSHLMIGEFKMNGLPEWESTSMTIQLKQSKVFAEDLAQYSSGFVLDAFNKLKEIEMQASFKGFPSDFVAEGAFKTLLGNFDTDIQLRLDTANGAASAYEGRLKTEHFQLGAFLDQPDLQTVNMDGTIKGTGFAAEMADLNVTAQVHSIGVLGYNYKGLDLKGTFRKNSLTGHITSADTNLVADIAGLVQIKPGNTIFTIAGNAAANMKELGFSAEPLRLSSSFETDFSGESLDPDHITGKAFLNESFVAFRNRSLKVPRMSLEVNRTGGEREIKFRSTVADLTAAGNFTYEEVSHDVPDLLKALGRMFTGEEGKFQQRLHYAEFSHLHHEKRRPYNINLDARLHDISPLTKLFATDLYLSHKTDIHIDFTSGLNTQTNLTVKADTVRYADETFYANSVDFSASKAADSADVLASLYVRSDKQQLGTLAPTENLRTDFEWDGNLIEFTADIAQTKSDNKINLRGGLNFFHDSLVLRMKPSLVRLIDRDWHFSPQNSVTYSRNSFNFRNMVITDSSQFVKITGVASAQASDSVNVRIEDFSIASLNTLFDGNLSGMLNGNLYVRSAMGTPGVHGKIALTNLMADKFLIGNIIATSSWDFNENKLRLNADLLRTDVNTLKITGWYNPNDEVSPLELKASIRNAGMVLMEPVLKGLISDWGGYADGDLDITGTLSKPIVSGDLKITDGRMRYDYLNTVWTFSDVISFGPNYISAKNLVLKDVNKHTAKLTKAILRHKYFEDWSVSLSADLNRFKVLNTYETPGTMYYGDVNASGDLKMEGPFSDLVIRANVKTEDGTLLYIPLDNQGATEKKSFITLFDHRREGEVLLKDSLNKKVDLSGITLDFNIEVTPEAKAEILLNRRSGDRIIGQGHGNLKLGLDTRGDFNLLGQYVFNSGIYKFTYGLDMGALSIGNVISKDIKIASGSTISWSGDPLAGQLNINALYEKNVSLKPIVENADQLTLPELAKNYPVQVNLNLTGELMHPQIQYGVHIKDGYPGVLSPSVSSFESRMQLNEQERSMQVFTMFMLGSLYNSSQGQLAGTSGSGSAIGSSFSELISSQLNNILKSAGGGIDVNVDLNSFENVNVGLGYQTGRFRIARSGGFTNLQSQATATSIVGDWTIEYMLTRSGVLRLKMSYRNVVTSSTTLNSQSSGSTSFSILHTQSFNRLGDIFKRKTNILAPAAPVENSSSPTKPDEAPLEQPKDNEGKEQKQPQSRATDLKKE
ncbi:MAG: translocation/assembly module TamB domain-containing protein [Bacteroidota bacterium]